VSEALGLQAAALGDDRIGRALDAIAPELDRIVGSAALSRPGYSIFLPSTQPNHHDQPIPGTLACAKDGAGGGV